MGNAGIAQGLQIWEGKRQRRSAFKFAKIWVGVGKSKCKENQSVGKLKYREITVKPLVYLISHQSDVVNNYLQFTIFLALFFARLDLNSIHH